MFGGKKEERANWAFFQEHYPEVVEGLKELKEWESVKSALADSERLGDYSILALAALVAMKREINQDIDDVREKIYSLFSKLDALKTDTDNNFKRIEKEIESLKEAIDELDRRTLVVSNLERVLPRITEMEERMLSYPLEVAESIEKRLRERIEERLEEIVREKLGELEERMNSVNPEVIREIIAKYDSLVRENVELRRKLEARERVIKDLREKLAKLQEGVKEVEAIEKKVEEYGRLAEELREIRIRLAKITGSYDPKEALRIIERNYIPRSKVEELAKTVKSLMKENEELKRENERLKKELDRITQAVKMLVEEGIIEAETSQEG
ncbi:hypothetical protein P8X37_09840 [Pyrococcus kukulkanii]|uniref:Uncharacterized protein n=2 Tax=Pyrococcus kukulkanii TaxID=1609559 RepID=A0A127B7L6_9EURY|nr:hypothetical protein [Pyrococcus kukulkanii]AMM53370.1 hypothetical protein TQ32_01835 [Pyrococcus kukulkanii]